MKMGEALLLSSTLSIFVHLMFLSFYFYFLFWPFLAEYSTNHINLPYIYVVTPTQKCLTQKADLTRLSHTLMHVPNLIWVVVEDTKVRTQLVTSFLDKTAVKSVHLNVSSIRNLPNLKGMAQRNEGLKWLKKNRENHRYSGIVYFADVDNTYSLDLFTQVNYLFYPGKLSFFTPVNYHFSLLNFTNPPKQLHVSTTQFRLCCHQSENRKLLRK